MRIKSLSFADPRGGTWSLDTLPLKAGLNLFVGASGSGKTRVLNIIFNIGRFASGDRFTSGQWVIHFEHKDTDYTWKCDSHVFGDDREPRVLSEELWIGAPTRVEKKLFTRSETIFLQGDKPVPKLPLKSTAIYLLREEPAITPAHEAFSEIKRRSFWSQDLQHSVGLQSIPSQLIRKLDKGNAEMPEIVKAELTLHGTLFLLGKYFPKAYTTILEQFRRVFPFITDIRVRPAPEALTVDLPVSGDFQVAMLKERGIEAPVPLQEIASGMVKVLLIITDVVMASPGLLYLIDEYENSLGVNAIDFLPSFLADLGQEHQFIITTHHPLLINAIPVSDWFIFHRKGLHIRVMHGAEIEERYGRSKQQRFTQLINDPLYVEGVE
jgi:energy-coupling factor transporter ATP-binding protein EcfA2